MTAPSYTEDLTDITNGTGDESSGWAESTDGAWDDQGPPAYQDADYPYIQGSYAVTADCTKTGTGSLFADHGTTFTIPTDGALFLWQNFSSPLALDTYANGGLRVMIGSDIGTFYSWDVGGKDFGKYPYGGWQNHVVNDTVSPDDTVNSYAGANMRYVGAGVKVLTGIGKGEVHQVDMMRFGRGSSIFEFGETADYCVFSGFAAQNDNSSNRWGLIQEIPGGYLWKGKMTLGTASNAVDFRDSNALIFIDYTPKVTANFNTIEINNASSNIEWTGVQVININTSSPSLGRLVMNADATVKFTNCVFTDMGTFVFDSNATLSAVTFRRCGQVTQADADIDDCIFDESSAAVALLCDRVDSVDNCDFTSDGTGHAIELTSAGSSFTLTGCTYSGYASSDGSTGNEVIYNNSGGAVTISIDGGDTPTVMNGSGASTTIVSGAVSVTVTAKTAAGVNVENARVLLRASDGTGPFPYQDTVTIVNVDNTGTVTHTAHGLATNDKVQIVGASLAVNNGVFSIIRTSDDTYVYSLPSTPGSSPTGTITSTFVALAGLTNSSGVLTTSRVYTSDQPVSGHARKSTSSPLYKSAPIVGDVDNVDGFVATAVMITDE